MVSAPPELEALTEKIIGCAIAVHRELGPGLLESVYRECLFIELDIEGCIVVVKSVDQLHPVFLAQVITYLKLANCPAGLLINFNVTSLRAGLRRLDHPHLYRNKKASFPPDLNSS